MAEDVKPAYVPVSALRELAEALRSDARSSTSRFDDDHDWLDGRESAYEDAATRLHDLASAAESAPSEEADRG